MFKKSLIAQSVLLAMAVPALAPAETTMKVELFNETAVYTKSGQTIGQARDQLGNGDSQSGGDLMKFENSAKIFLNGDIGEESSWHGEIKIIYDSEAVNDEDNGGVNYKGHESYSQNDFFRELYVDTKVSDWYLRLGKQQVVWGTADGIKLLDIINPTDYREFSQNTMEDSRIPIWMINAEKNIGDTGNLQFVLSEARENRIAGLNRGGDQGQPFVMQGVDTITGASNGFINIAPSLANVATIFSGMGEFGYLPGLAFGAPGSGNNGLTKVTNFTVDGFSNSQFDITNAAAGTGALVLTGFGTVTATSDSVNNIINTGGVDQNNGFVLLNAISQDPASLNPGFAGFSPLGNGYVTKLTDVEATNGTANTVNWNMSAPSAAFDHMPNATFATFNSFSGGLGFLGSTGASAALNTTYVRDYPDSLESNMGFRFKDSTTSGFNYSFNYFYHYDANPSVDISLHDAQTKQRLTTQLWHDNFAGTATKIARNDSRLNSPATGTTSVLLKNEATNQYYGAYDPTTVTLTGISMGDAGSTLSQNGVEMRFTESLNRIHSIGAAFDTAYDGLDFPLVIRGEFLYDKDVKQPVVDKRLLAIGDLEGALKSEETDFFKYVIGADITVMTNLLVSAQFIQFINLDFQEDNRTCATQSGKSFDCSRYTADPTTMSVNNSLQKGYEFKEMYSLFFSKPIGEEQLGRWNNITIFEEGGGYWNRLDADYSVTDNFIVNAAWNNYWGDENTTFGQLKDSSSVQVGFKYIFEDY